MCCSILQCSAVRTTSSFFLISFFLSFFLDCRLSLDAFSFCCSLVARVPTDVDSGKIPSQLLARPPRCDPLAQTTCFASGTSKQQPHEHGRLISQGVQSHESLVKAAREKVSSEELHCNRTCVQGTGSHEICTRVAEGSKQTMGKEPRPRRRVRALLDGSVPRPSRRDPLLHPMPNTGWLKAQANPQLQSREPVSREVKNALRPPASSPIPHATCTTASRGPQAPSGPGTSQSLSTCGPFSP